MNPRLKQNIKEQLSLRNMSVSELERQAGLKPSTIQNILHNRSKNPGIDTIQPIAQALQCSIEELIGELSHKPIEKVEKEDEFPWNATLYIKAIQTAQSILEKKQKIISKKQILASVEEIYKYSLNGISHEIDTRFAEWLLAKL